MISIIKSDDGPATSVLLLVEDEPDVCELLGDALTDAGYSFVVSINAREAMAELDKNAQRFQAVITDINIGTGQNGWDVGHHARKLLPHMPIIYMSGNRGDEWASKGVPHSVMIAKPFALSQLVTAVSVFAPQSQLYEVVSRVV